MPFYSFERIVSPDVPFRVYVHGKSDDEIERVFGSPGAALEKFRAEVFRPILTAVKGGDLTPPNPQYGIATIWAEDPERFMTDVWVYGDLAAWQDNPQHASGVFQNGDLLNLRSRVNGCGESEIMRGLEQELRSKTLSREKYIITDTPLVGHRLWQSFEQ